MDNKIVEQMTLRQTRFLITKMFVFDIRSAFGCLSNISLAVY